MDPSMCAEVQELPTILGDLEGITCTGNETSLLQCSSSSSAAEIALQNITHFPKTCGNGVVACGLTSESVHPVVNELLRT